MRKSHEIEYEVRGSDLQYVEVILDPGETVISEPGAMMYMEKGVQMKTGLSDGSEKSKGFFGSIASLGKRYLSGENVFISSFTNNSTVPACKLFTEYLGAEHPSIKWAFAPFPKIIKVCSN